MEDIEKFHQQLYAPMPGRSPDRVRPEVIQDELNAFAALQQQT